MCYLVLEDPLGERGLDDVGPVEAVDAVDAEDALLLAHHAVRVHPAVPHRLQHTNKFSHDATFSMIYVGRRGNIDFVGKRQSDSLQGFPGCLTV